MVRHTRSSSASTDIRLSCCWCHNRLPFTEKESCQQQGQQGSAFPHLLKPFIQNVIHSSCVICFSLVDIHLKQYDKQKMFAFLLGGYEHSKYFSNKITQNTVLSDGLFFTQSYFFQGQNLFPVKSRGDSQLIAMALGYCIRVQVLSSKLSFHICNKVSVMCMALCFENFLMIHSIIFVTPS